MKKIGVRDWSVETYVDENAELRLLLAHLELFGQVPKQENFLVDSFFFVQLLGLHFQNIYKNYL